ncbi:NACHT domain-containing protein, partial [Flavobacterium psychrophilum]
MSKKGGEFEIIAIDFLEKIFNELKFAVVRKRIQISGSQDGYDNLVDIVDDKYLSRSIYSECKDYTSELNYNDAFIKLPQIASTHNKIDLVLFISPKKDFSNIFEETRNKPFLESLTHSNFKVTILSPETHIQKYFSLYPEIYKKVYKEDSPVLLGRDREEILKQFDKFIFSDQSLQKIVIDDYDKEKYIGKIQVDKYHIKRSIRNSQKREYDFYFPISNKKTLLSEIYENKLGVILLGNPGFGKTSELKQLAVELWNTRDTTNIIPTFRSLKNFTYSSKIEDFLPQNFKLIPRQVMIFDGIDEIENIIDFSNKLRNFITNNLELFDDEKIKLIISCRTNIYKKYIKNISDLGIYFLNEISVSSGLNFLETKYNLNLEDNKTFDTYKNKEILENPFYLDLIGNYYKNHNEILTKKALLIEEFVNSRLSDDKANKFRNDKEFDKERIISYTQKIAFSFEAMQKPFLTAVEIKRVAQVDEISLAKNSFLEENIADNWSFILKNIQEYFVASILSDLSFEGIIKLIQIDNDTKKVHPTWYNVVTFLLNLISDETLYNSLIDWLLENDFELLFNADSDRITDVIKSKVLQNLFTKNCIEDNLWINDPKSIASFSECNTNVEYLISQLKDVSIHRRARMSAIKLLSYMNIPTLFSEQIKTSIIDIINENNFADENYVYLIQDAIMLTKSIGLNEDVIFFNQIIKLLKNRDNKEIISSITYSVPDQSTADNVDYFLEILDKSIGNKEWNSVSKYNSVTSTKDKIFNLFTNIKDGDILLKIYEFSIERQKNYQFRESLIKGFLAHIKEFFKPKKEFHSKLIDLISNAVISDKANYYEDGLLLEVVKSCSIEKELFDIIIDSIDGNSDSKRFLTEITDRNDFEKILQKYKKAILNEEFLNQFRNVLSHKNYNLSKEFENYIESNSHYVFQDKFSKEGIDERNEFWSTREQKNFDVLFDKNEIVNQILKLYEHLGKDNLNFKDIDKYYHRYYDDFELQKKVTENAKHLLYEILRDNYPADKKLNKAMVYDEILNSNLNIMYDILNCLPKEDKSKKIKISETQNQFIKQWCDDNTHLAKEYYLSHLSVSDSWNNNKYYLFEAIYKFQKLFKFNLDEELLLDMLWFNSTEKGIITDYLDGIVSIENIKNRITHNLLNVKLSPSSFCNHLKYCIENKINIECVNLDLKSKIYGFLNSGKYYYAGEIIDNFFNKDIETLKELLNYTSLNNNETRRFLYDCII